MFSETSREKVPFFVFQDLESVPGFVHAFTSRRTDLACVSALGGRRLTPAKPHLLEVLNLRPENLFLLKQVHSARVWEPNCTKGGPGTIPGRERADGIILTKPGCYAVVRTADCLPILALAPTQRMVCCLHAGWRGTRDHIAYQGLARFLALSGVSPAETFVGFGPCIRSCCYEVGGEVREQFAAGGHDVDEIFEGRMLDLVKANLADLRKLGIRKVADSGMCTVCRADLFYSHRRDRDRRRMWALAGFRH